MKPAILLGLVLVTSASAAVAADWVSPDGKLAIDTPTSHGFTAEPNPQVPLVAQWSSRDGRTTIAFLTLANPRNQPLDARGLEQGMLQETGGSILSSTRREISGVPVYTIISRGNKTGLQLYFVQHILAFSGTAYKFMACSPSDISQDATVNQIFQSMRILDPSPKAPRGGFDTYTWSSKIGSWACSFS